MKFIVEPQKEERQDKGGHKITMCVLCGEDPDACGYDPI